MAANTTSSANPSVNTAVVPYTYGLNGVSLSLDNASTQSLYILIGFVCCLIVGVRLFQLASSHLRTITSFTATPEQQRYWTENPTTWWPWLKRHLLWAPLLHKRHHREIQLSGAHNMGIIPGRLHTLLLSLFFISQLVYMLILDYGESVAKMTAELRGRSGHLSALNMILLFLFAGRNNPFIRILRVSFDTFNLFHRWIGRVVVIEAVVHTIAWAMNKYSASGWDGINQSLGDSPFIQYGFLGTVSMLIILLQSPSPIRHAFYETFLHLHQLLAFLALLGVFMHARLGSLPQLPFVALVVCIWCYDRIVRTARLVYYNVSWRHGLSRVTIEALPGDVCRATFHLPRNWTPPPGAHVYAYLPGVSFWQSHPFSVAWSTPTATLPDTLMTATTRALHSADDSDLEKVGSTTVTTLPGSFADGTSVSLVMQARSGMTRRLYERARMQPGARLHSTGLLEGPYGALESLASYGTVVLFAGGIGITHQLPLLRSLLAGHADGTAATRRVVLVWSMRTVEALEWVRPFMDELLRWPGRRDVLRIRLFVTRPAIRSVGAGTLVSASDRVTMEAGRADPLAILNEECAARVGAMCVGVCGPGVFADEVRAAARTIVQVGKVDFWEEGFTW